MSNSPATADASASVTLGDGADLTKTQAGASVQADSELFVPLSFGDRLAGVEHAATLIGWVVPRASAEEELDVARLEEALWRVGERWRLLAGRIEEDGVSGATRRPRGVPEEEQS